MPGSENELLDDDITAIRNTTRAYCEALLSSLSDRFPENDVFYAFRIFDHRELPNDLQDHALYGNSALELLINKLNVVSDSQRKLKVINDYQTLINRLVMEEFNHGKNADEFCTKISRYVIYRQMFPELYRLCCIALSIPLSTAWPERGFSTLCRVKSKQRNRMLDTTLNALINVSINAPKQLSDEDGLVIAENANLCYCLK